MLTIGVVFLGIGSVGMVTSVILEIKLKEPKYKILQKVFPWFMGIGGILVGLAISGAL